MSVTRLPPNPRQAPSLEVWATQFYQYYINNSLNTAVNDPRPELLAHQKPASRDSAATAGTLMYDPVIGNVVVSKGGVWLPIAYEP